MTITFEGFRTTPGERSSRPKHDSEINILINRIQRITQAIVSKLSRALGLASPRVSSTESDFGYMGSVSMGHSIGLVQRIGFHLELTRINELVNIESGLSVKDAGRRMDSLNFLVHHEIAHVVQSRQNLLGPRIGTYEEIGQEDVEHNANEVLVDKIGFALGRQIYVFHENPRMI